jgi:peptidoglycan/LPS O-acetylase OafA/YrhL
MQPGSRDRSRSTSNPTVQATGPTACTGHWPELDGLRGLAILLVVAYHNSDMFSAIGGVMRVPALVAGAGWFGVQLFFVLSGFLITHNLLKSRGATNYLSAFFARRVLRIFPLYYSTLLMFLVVLPLVVVLPVGIAKTYKDQIWLWVFLSNWNTSSGGGVYWFPHYWSLAIEEQFYLVWPFVIAGFSERLLWPILAFVIVTAIAIRSMWLHAAVPPQVIYTVTLCRMDALACGALGALMIQRTAFRALVRRNATTILFGVAGLLATIALTTRFQPYDTTMVAVGYTVIAFAMAGPLLVSVAGHSTRAGNTLRLILAFAPLRSVGKVSYAMYVFHVPLLMLLRPTILGWASPAGRVAPLLVGLGMIGLAYLAGVLSYLLVERWFLGLKGRFTPRAPPPLGRIA